jgi:plastocyanin
MITCTVSNGTTSHTASKTITAKSAPTAGTIGTVTITGSATATVGVATSYTASFSGTVAASQVLYGWAVDLDDATITGSGQASASITFDVAGTYIVSCQLNSASASDGPVRTTKTVTVT